MFVFSNLAISLDGKIATATREHFPLGTPLDLKTMLVLRKRADAILMGASSLRTYRKPLLSAKRNPKHPVVNVIVSKELKGVDPTWPFFKTEKTRRIVYITGKISSARLARFLKVSEVVQIPPQKGEGKVSSWILKNLDGRFGIKRLLVEGGGQTMWDFAQGNLIDEYHVTLTPRILGGSEAPTLVDGKGFAAKDSLKLQLVRCKRVGDELYLTYRKNDSKA